MHYFVHIIIYLGIILYHAYIYDIEDGGIINLETLLFAFSLYSLIKVSQATQTKHKFINSPTQTKVLAMRHKGDYERKRRTKVKIDSGASS